MTTIKLAKRQARLGLEAGVLHTDAVFRRSVLAAALGGAPPTEAVAIARRNVDRSCRSLGRRATGVDKATQVAKGSVKRTGKGVNRHATATDQATRAADSRRQYVAQLAKATRSLERSHGQRAQARRLKGALRLAAKLASQGEHGEAVRVLRAA